MNLYQVLKVPVTTEKTTQGEKIGKYVFLINPQANKIEVKNAIREIYGVEVEKVNIVPVLPKVRLGAGRRIIPKREAAKKAFITLKAGKKLDLTKFPKSSK